MADSIKIARNLVDKIEAIAKSALVIFKEDGVFKYTSTPNYFSCDGIDEDLVFNFPEDRQTLEAIKAFNAELIEYGAFNAEDFFYAYDEETNDEEEN